MKLFLNWLDKQNEKTNPLVYIHKRVFIFGEKGDINGKARTIQKPGT